MQHYGLPRIASNSRNDKWIAAFMQDDRLPRFLAESRNDNELTTASGNPNPSKN
ncbi:MAG: hypothetical protein HDT10_06475 [Helicobacter sp.]|nr:hypothetical protein [Helicobacter sp.]